ncbi:unnamed protein product [Urochloa humidicola]
MLSSMELVGDSIFEDHAIVIEDVYLLHAKAVSRATRVRGRRAEHLAALRGVSFCRVRRELGAAGSQEIS